MGKSEDEKNEAEEFLASSAYVLVFLTKNFSGDELLPMIKDISQIV